jgi:hypothetical protein
MTPTSTHLSLLAPPDALHSSSSPAAALSEADLGLGPIIRALDIEGQHSRFIGQVLAQLVTDPLTIAYRQNVLDDLLRAPDLAEQLLGLLPRLRSLGETPPFQRLGDESSLILVAGRLAELDNYVTCLEELWRAFSAHIEQLHSEGLRALHTTLAAARADPDYLRLCAELPRLRAQMEQASSVTIGVNLNSQLQPEAATIVAISSERFSGARSLLGRLLGERAASETLRGLTSLYKADGAGGQSPEHELFRDLRRLIERVAAPVASVIDQYRRIRVGRLASIAPELAFYLGAARLTQDLRRLGLALCRPTIEPAQARICKITDCYALDLALRLRAMRGDAALAGLVANEVRFDHTAYIALLTGPNSGGKTTYTRAIGQAQVLFQAGLLVPGRAAQLSPADSVLTHFASAERLDLSGGRLAEELERLAAIFRVATPASLVLLNEPLTSTDQRSARALGRDLLAGLHLLGARTLFVTHIQELVDDALSLAPEGAGVSSLVAGIDLAEDKAQTPSYRIEPGLPRPHHQASALARSYGLSQAQIVETLRQRGVIPPKS